MTTQHGALPLAGLRQGLHRENLGLSVLELGFSNLTEAEDIKKRWQEYTEELYKKELHDPDNYDGMITHLESQTSWNVKSSQPRKHHCEQN